jgi:hypothetical protein
VDDLDQGRPRAPARVDLRVVAAGAWALGREPSLEVVRDALRQRHNDPRHPIDPAQVRARK